MLEELIEEYMRTKEVYEKLSQTTRGFSIALAGAQSNYGEAADALLDFVAKHSDTLIAWEREHALRLSPFDE